MFKSARWRSEKNKIKIVFKLQFHATQVICTLSFFFPDYVILAATLSLSTEQTARIVAWILEFLEIGGKQKIVNLTFDMTCKNSEFHFQL